MEDMGKMNTSRHLKSYSELILLPTYDERYSYLKIGGSIGDETFGFDRYLNQLFYNSNEWRHFRNEIIIRDNGMDMAHPDYPINGLILIHHINPLTKEDIINRSPSLFDPENVICVSKLTHNAIHYGDDSFLRNNQIIERVKNDTCPWKKGV